MKSLKILNIASVIYYRKSLPLSQLVYLPRSDKPSPLGHLSEVDEENSRY